MNFDPCFNILYGYYREKMGQTTVLLRSLSPGKPNRLNVVCPLLVSTVNTVFMSRQLSEGKEERKHPRISPGMRRPQRNAMPQ